MAGRALAASAEEVAEDGVEEVGNDADVSPVAARHIAGPGAESVEGGALAVVGKHGVGQRDLLELLFGGVVAGIAVGGGVEREEGGGGGAFCWVWPWVGAFS